MSRAMSTKSLFGYAFQPVRRALYRAFIRWQLDSMNRHIESLQASIDNDREAIRELQYERTFLALRLK